MASRYYLGLGTNLGDRRTNLRRALLRLGELVTVEALSSVYESEPVGDSAQPDFWNMAVRVRTDLDPESLLEAVKGIEREFGRKEGPRNAPRPIDIDLLLYDDRRFRAAGLDVPHPGVLTRAFVLKPLTELDPELRHPGTGRLLRQHLAESELERAEPIMDGWRLLEAND